MARKYWNENITAAYDLQDKSRCIFDAVSYMINRCNEMFTYENLPDSIPSDFLELFLQTNGHCCITEVEGELYALTGGLGGVPDAYYRPTEYVVSNPALKFSKNLKIDEECVFFKNDTMLKGLIPLHSKYATMLCENELSMMIADINLRIQSVFLCDNDSDKVSADVYIKRVIDGYLESCMNSDFFEGIKLLPTASTGQGNQITQLIELEQYIKASWYNDLGLQSNYNMKRESINSNESELNADALLPLIQNMLKCRVDAIDKVNAMFGTDITVKLNEPWISRKEDITESEEDVAEEVEQEEVDEVEQDDEEVSEDET